MDFYTFVARVTLIMRFTATTIKLASGRNSHEVISGHVWGAIFAGMGSFYQFAYGLSCSAQHLFMGNRTIMAERQAASSPTAINRSDYSESAGACFCASKFYFFRT